MRDTPAAPEPEPAAAEGSDEEDADAALAAALMNGSNKKGKKGKRAAFVLPEESEAAGEDTDGPQLADSTALEAEPAVTDGAAIDDEGDAPQPAATADDDADAPQPATAPQEPADEAPVFGKKKKKKTADAASLFAALDLDTDGPAANGSAGDAATGELFFLKSTSFAADQRRLTRDCEPRLAACSGLSCNLQIPSRCAGVTKPKKKSKGKAVADADSLWAALEADSGQAAPDAEPGASEAADAPAEAEPVVTPSEEAAAPSGAHSQAGC